MRTGHRTREEQGMLAMNSRDTVSFSDFTLLRVLRSQNHRPNLMILNQQASLGSVLQQLSAVCQAPLWICQLPGALELPTANKGTLVLGNIDQLMIGQQIRLFDWLARKDNEVQIVSITPASMTQLIEEGRFLEGLFFRLNTVVIRATSPGDYDPSW
jgi:hypothetical protein